MVDQAAAQVLAHQEILMASPAASKLNSFYPNPSESECTIAQAVCNSGQLFIQANSKNIGGSSDFMVSTPNIMDCPQLLMSFTVKAIPEANNAARAETYMCTYHDGWGFDAIERLEVSFANSNISNLQIQGHAMRDWSLLQCKNADERKQMLKIAGRGKTWTREKDMTLEACIPLSFLFFRTAGGVKGGFGIDGRVLNGPITFQFHFKPINYFCGPAASVYDRQSLTVTYDLAQPVASRNASYPSSALPGDSLPTQFDRLELTMRTYQLMDGTFSVSKALEANPSLIYSIPSLWMNTYTQEVKIDGNGKGSININSVPAGMIQAIIMRIRPVNQTKYIAPYNVTSGDVGDATDDQDANTSSDYQYLLNYEPPVFNGQVIRPAAAGGDNANQQTGVTPAYRPYVPWSLPVSEIKLQYSGQAIYYAKTQESHDGFTRSIFNDDLKTDICGLPLTQSVVGQRRVTNYKEFRYVDPANTTGSEQFPVTELINLGDSAMVNHETQVTVIPLMHDGDSIFRKRGFENLPHYSGSTLQLDFQMKEWNTYNCNGLDRIQCEEKQGLQFVTASNVLTEIYDKYSPSSGWRAEKEVSSCASIPSNRLQHVASCRGPRTRDIASDSTTGGSAGAVIQNRERVIFNNNPDIVNADASANGARAYSSGSGGVVRVDLTYVVASLFQVTNGVAELQL